MKTTKTVSKKTESVKEVAAEKAKAPAVKKATTPKAAPKAAKEVAPKVTAPKEVAAPKEAPVKAAAPKAVAPKAAAPKAPKASKKITQAPVSHGVGRRKSSVARVWLRKGAGAFVVNGKEVLSYFDTDVSRASALAPWTILPQLSKEYDIEVNVIGGGKHSQADAVKLGVARAVIEVRDDARDTLRAEGLLTVDSRIKERKKYGQKGARRKFQFVKR